MTWKPFCVSSAKSAGPTENFAAQISKLFHLSSLKPFYIAELEQSAAFLKTFLLRNIPTLCLLAFLIV
jgi:hypothetical protein